MDALLKNTLEWLYLYAKSSKERLFASVVSNKSNELEDTFNDIAQADNNLYHYGYNKGEHIVNNSVIEFFSPSDLVKVHYPKRDILISVNVDNQVQKELALRTVGYAILLRDPFY